VRLLLVYYKQLDYKKDVRQTMMESAETYAQRLVGAGQKGVTMSWSDEVENWDGRMQRPCFGRYLAVERRVRCLVATANPETGRFNLSSALTIMASD
jgi:hypothetical protein